MDLADKVSRFTQLASLSGDGLAIADTEEGVVYIFNRSTAGWSLERKITKKDFPLLRMPEKNQDGGYPQLSVSLNGDALAVGAAGFDAAYVFRKSTKGWDLEQEITKVDLAGSAPRGQGLGGSVAIKGGILVVAASRPDAAVFIFEKTGDGSWSLAQEVSKVTIPGIWQGNPHFGKPLVIADNGTVMLNSVQATHFFKRAS